jgi:HAD superfamily hydrolase (TIGR01662 family)
MLLDFDGPVCSVFAGISDRAVADHLRSFIKRAIPADVANSSDPFDVLQYARSLNGSTARLIESEFRNQEVAAVAVARETNGTLDAVKTIHTLGYTITIVSNNSVDAVNSYLHNHELGLYVTSVSARNSELQSPLKPDPFLILQAIRSLDTTPSLCFMVGDSVADIDAAHAAGVPVIAFANKPGKNERFQPHKPEAVITNMHALVASSYDSNDGIVAHDQFSSNDSQ